jgi:hypothetical protein
MVRIGDLIQYEETDGTYVHGLVMKIDPPAFGGGRLVYCSWFGSPSDDPWHWSWVREEEAEIISESR